MARRCGPDGNCGPRTNWWKQSMEVDWYSGGGSNPPEPPEDSEYPLGFGSDLGLWVNGRNRDSKTTSGFQSSILNSMISDDPDAHSITTVGAINFTKFSGNWLYCHLNQGMVNAETTPYTFLSNGTDFELWVSFFPIAVTTTTLWTLLGNNDGSTAKTGFELRYDNRSASSMTNAITWLQTRSQSGVPVISANAQNAVTPGQWNHIRVRRTGTSIFIDVNGVNKLTQANAAAPLTSAPSDSLTFFKASTASSRFITNGLTRQIVAVKRNLTADEVTNMYDYFDEGSLVIGGGDNAYVFGLIGQSNMLGLPGSPPAYLQDPTGSYIYNAGVMEELDYPVNQQSNSGTSFGPELEFGYRMNLAKPGEIYFCKRGVSSTSLFYDGVDSTSWNVAAGTTNGLIHTFINNRWLDMLRMLKYQLNKTILIRALDMRQGEADAATANPNGAGGAAFVQSEYKADLGDMYKLFLDSTIAAGYDTSKCRLVIAQCDNNFTPGERPYRDNIVAASLDVCQNMRAEDPTYASKCLDGIAFSTASYTLSDGTHFDGPSQVQHGFDHYSNLVSHLDE